MSWRRWTARWVLLLFESRDAPVHTLCRHGIDIAVAREVEAVGADLRSRTRKNAVEYAAMIDMDTGAAIGEILQGQRRTIKVGPHLKLLQTGHRYIQIHSHPGDAPFSFDDVRLLLERPAIRVSIVVGSSGVWYVMSKGSRIDDLPPERIRRVRAEIKVTLMRLRHRLQPKYDELFARGVIEAPEYWPRLFHDAWSQIAPNVDLRYDRAWLA